jgi:hypothetical protein
MRDAWDSALRKHGSQAPWRRPIPARLILAAAAMAALIGAPVTLGPHSLMPAWQLAAAKSDGGGHGGRGDSGGRGNGHDARGQGRNEVGGGWAFGNERHEDRIEQARQRYGAALGHAKTARRGSQGDDQRVAYSFSADEAQQLIEHGWRTRAISDGGFKNHGERVQTMVELAKRLGYGARVGALQANFGTPYENGIARLEADLAAARADAAAGDEQAAARVGELEAQLEAAVAAAKPGKSANHDWARADLDVNRDGVVDQRDLGALDAALDVQEAPPS